MKLRSFLFDDLIESVKVWMNWEHPHFSIPTRWMTEGMWQSQDGEITTAQTDILEYPVVSIYIKAIIDNWWRMRVLKGCSIS